jgi:hypothetical protein
MLTLERRYHHIHLRSPVIAEAFSHHHLHPILQGPRHVRKVSVDLPSYLSRSDLEKFTTALSRIPASLLTDLSINAPCKQEVISKLLGNVTDIRKLSVTSSTLSWCMQTFGRTNFRALEYLEVRTTGQTFPRLGYEDPLGKTLQLAPTIKTLDLGYKKGGTLWIPMCWGYHDHVHRNDVLPERNDTAQVESLTFRDFSFRDTFPLRWYFFEPTGLNTLRFLHCYEIGRMLQSLPLLVKTCFSLTTFEVVLLNTNMEQNPTVIQSLERILYSLPRQSLKRLRIEIPAAEHFPHTNSITHQKSLETLVMGVTDTHGRWLTLEPGDLEMVVTHCSKLRCVGLSLPPLQTCYDFLV